MKTKKLFILLIFVLTFYNIQNNSAQNEPAVYKNEIRMGPFQLLRNGMHLSYEKYYNNVSYVIIGELTFNKQSGKEITGFLTELQYRNYIIPLNDFNEFGLMREGIYVGPAIKFRYKEIDKNQYNDKIYSLGFNLLVGCKYSVLERLTLDVNVGGSFIFSEIETERIDHDYDLNMYSPGYSGIAPTANVTCGFKF